MRFLAKLASEPPIFVLHIGIKGLQCELAKVRDLLVESIKV